MKLKRISDNLRIQDYKRAKSILSKGFDNLIKTLNGITDLSELQTLAESAYVVIDAESRDGINRLNNKALATEYMERALDLGASAEEISFMGVFLNLIDSTGTPVFNEPLKLGYTLDFTLETPEDVWEYRENIRTLGILCKVISKTTILQSGSSRLVFAKSSHGLYSVGLNGDTALSEATGLNVARLSEELTLTFINNFIIKYADES